MRPALSVVLRVVIDLVRELNQIIVRHLSTGKLFPEHEAARFYSSQVKAHVKIGSAGSALHVEHLHRVIAVILEYVISFGTQRKNLAEFLTDLILRKASCAVITPEHLIQSRSVAGAHNLARPEINRALEGGSDAAKVENQLIIHIEPEIVVSGKLEDDVMSPGVQTILCLRKARRHLHSEEVVRIFLRNQVKLFSLPGICIGKFISHDICRVCDQLPRAVIRILACLDGVIRHELSVYPGFSGRLADRGDLVIDGKAAVIVQVREV